MEKTVLIVSASPTIRMLIKNALIMGGYAVAGQAATGQGAISQALQTTPDILVINSDMPDMLSIDVIKQLNAKNFTAYMVMLIQEGDVAAEQRGYYYGAKAVIAKPFSPEQLLAALSPSTPPSK